MDDLQIIAIVGASIIFVFSLIHFAIFEKIKKVSLMYKKLRILNKKYAIREKLPEKKDFYEKCTNKRAFNMAIIDDYLQKRIQTDMKTFDDIILKNESAYQNYRSYVKEYNALHPGKMGNISRFKFKDLRTWVFNLYEQLIFRVYKLKPLRYTKTFVKISYHSPQGKNNYTKSNTYSYEALKRHYNDVRKAIEQGSTRQNLIRIERAKVSPSLRIAVFKRDHNSCQICGATKSDGVMLHVDHIIPVSRGGKTEMKNLQTLCDRCNFGKSDRTDLYELKDK